MNLPKTVPSTDGVELRLHDLGGDGPPLLMSHATGFCGPVWGPLAEGLHQSFRCVAFDFRGHGHSSKPDVSKLAWRGFGQDVLAAVDAVSECFGHPGPLPAVGHSMGGAALVLAEADRPGTLSKVWTFEPILFEGRSEATPPQPSEISEGARRRRPTFASRDEAFERYSSRPPLSSLDERVLRAYVDHGFADQDDGTVTLCCSPEHEAAVFERHNSGVRSLVGQLTIPFLAAASGDGRPPAETVIAVADEYPNVELARYDQLNHFGPLQDPSGLADDILTWMSSH